MGKGDMKSKRGKIHSGSYGKKRPRHAEKLAPVAKELEEKKKTAKPKEKAVKPVEAVAEEPKAKKAPAKAKAKKETTDQPDLFDTGDAAKTE